METITKKLIDQYILELNKLFTEGLRLKGFEFNNSKEIEVFIKSRCRCEHYTHLNEKIYYVDDIPFLIYIENKDININYEDTKSFKASMDLGEYAYL
jgi:hypothetical protein